MLGMIYTKLSDTLHLKKLNLNDFAKANNLTKKRVIEKQGSLFLVRNFLKNETIEILYHPNGRPYLANGVEISISHSYDWLVVLFSYEKEKIGVDIEKISQKVINIKDKFLSDDELVDLETESPDKYTTYWAVKEAVYKAFDTEHVVFGDEILIENFSYSQQGGKINALVKRPDTEKKYTLAYEVFSEYVLVYTL